jgi:hypothetical protein
VPKLVVSKAFKDEKASKNLPENFLTSLAFHTPAFAASAAFSVTVTAN